MGKTISFVKGRGHISHNNRDFISNNVVPERTDWNRTYVKESIESAYDTCFGQALNDYNARQKRKDRQKHDYITEIKNSKNKEKVFYENVVQIGSKNDTAVVDENDRMTEEAEKAAKLHLKNMHRHFRREIRICICSTVCCTWTRQRRICTWIIFRWRTDISPAWRQGIV